MAEKITPATFETTLPPKIRNALIAFWGNPEIVRNPEIVADLGSGALCAISRIGPKSLRAIADLLHRLGYLDAPESWLKEGKRRGR